MSENNIVGVILAGGKSRRFGVDKCTTKLGDKTLIEHTISKIEKKFSEILIISNNQEIKVDKKKCICFKRLHTRSTWSFSWGIICDEMGRKKQ